MTYMFLLICNLLTGAVIGLVADSTETRKQNIVPGVVLGFAFWLVPVAGHATYVYLGGL